MVGSDVEVLDGDEDVGGVFLLGLVSDPAWQGLSQKVCGGGASSLEKRPGFLLWGVVLAREMSLNVSLVSKISGRWERTSTFSGPHEKWCAKLFVLPGPVKVVGIFCFFSPHPGEICVLIVLQCSNWARICEILASRV